MSKIFSESTLNPPRCHHCNKEQVVKGRFEVVDGHFICQSCMASEFASYKSCPGDYCNANKIPQDAELCETCTLMNSD